MKYSKDLLKEIESSKTILDEMIVKAEEQGARNFEILFTLQNGLNELSMVIKDNQNLSPQFLKKWDLIMGWAPKVFEDHPLLELLKRIDNKLIEAKSY